MSFRCEGTGCKKVGSTPNRVVTKKRLHKHMGWKEIDGQMVYVQVGEGTQIVEEKNLCNDCTAKVQV